VGRECGQLPAHFGCRSDRSHCCIFARIAAFLQTNFLFRLSYFAANAVGLTILYASADSILYVEHGKARDANLEFWLWAVMVSAAVPCVV
jgi:hypothetical protein